ncbi:MAG TPA: hypothetical protein P5560_08875 [Thermotogota bacterium]|nr:hypothetical protein [Thermotogota bacterium]
MKLNKWLFVSTLLVLMLLLISCAPIAIPDVEDEPPAPFAPEIYLENNFGFSGVHFPKAEPTGEIFPAAWFGDTYGFIVSPANEPIAAAELEVFAVEGGRVPWSHNSVYGPVNLTLAGGCHFDHDWTATFETLPVGKYELRITATDASGRSNYKALTFYVHDIYLQDTIAYNQTHSTADDIVIEVLGLTGGMTFTLTDALGNVVDPQPVLVGTQIQVGTLPQGGYNLLVETANGVQENYLYSFFVTDQDGPAVAFYNNPESGNTSYTGDGFIEWKIANWGPQLLDLILFRESTHSRQMMFFPIQSLFIGGMPANNVVTITSSQFTQNDHRVKLDVVGMDALGSASAMTSQYFIYKGMSDEFLYLHSTAYDRVVYPGDEVVLELELKNVKDFGAFYSMLLFNPALVPAEDLTITFPSIKGTSNKTELSATNLDDYGFAYWLEMMKAVVDTPGTEVQDFTGNGIFARISFTVPVDAQPGAYNVFLVNTLIRDGNNHEKGEVRDDLGTTILVGSL